MIQESLPSKQRITVLSDALLETIPQDTDHSGLYFENAFSEALSFLTNKYPSKILYYLYEAGFTSYWEASLSLKLDNMHWIWKTIGNLESANIVEQLRQEKDNFLVIKNFWRAEHPTSPKTPKLYSLRNTFRVVVEAYKDTIIRQYFSSGELGAIAARKRRWEEFSSRVEKQKEALERRKSISLGDCLVCGHIIKDSCIKGKDYHAYVSGLVCRQCQTKATKQQIRKWISTRD